MKTTGSTGITAGSSTFAAVMLINGVCALAASAATFEPEVRKFRAADLQPARLLKGPNHQIQPEVVNKGYLNNYRISTPFGDFSAFSDSQVPILVQEINAIAELKKMSKSEVFAESAVDAAKKPIAAAQTLVEKPVETVKGIPAGVGRLFARTKDRLEEVSEKAQKAEKADGESGSSADAVVAAGSDLAKSYFGVGSAQRKLARELKVDPYSTNKVLQQELGSMAKYAAAGSFGTKLILPSLPGQGLVKNVTDLVWNLSARDLRLRNEKSLLAMGADEAVVKRFIDNPYLTPTDQTRFVVALETLAGTRGREVPLERLAAIQTRAEALAQVRLVEMLVGYHKKRTKIAAIVDSGRNLPLAVSTKGAAIIAVPIDYLGWSEGTATAVKEFGELAGKHAAGGPRQVWLEGRASEQFRNELNKAGWQMTDLALQRLRGDK